MAKKKNHSLFIILIIAVLLIVMSVLFFKFDKSQPETTSAIQKSEQYSETQTDKNELQGEEESEIRAYTSTICNTNLGNRLPEFSNINDAYKPWIYAHITRDDSTFFMTENEIKENLKETFGDELILDVKKDTAEYDDISMPSFDEENGDYTLPAFGMDNRICYEVNSIQKSDNVYTVNVIEYNVATDFDTNEQIISAYNKNDDKKRTEIFRVSEDESADKIKEEVMKQKNKFISFNITIENTDNQFILQKITAD